MEDPDKKRSPIIDVILILLIIALGFILYRLVAGDWMPGNMTGGSDPLGQITESINILGRGLRDVFSNIVP